MNQYYLSKYRQYSDYRFKIQKEIAEITDNKVELEAMLAKHSRGQAAEFIRKLGELETAWANFALQQDLFFNVVYSVSEYTDRYSYSGNNPVTDLAVQQYNQNQADKQQQLENKRKERLNAVIEAYDDLESKLTSIRRIFQSYSDEYNAILTPYREKKLAEQQAAQQAAEAAQKVVAEKDKKIHKICLVIAIVATLIISIIFIIVGASMDAVGFAMGMLLLLDPLLGVGFYWLAMPIVVKIMYK